MAVLDYGGGFEVETSEGMTDTGGYGAVGSGRYGQKIGTPETAKQPPLMQWKHIQQFFDAEGNLKDREGLQGYVWTYFPDVIRDMRGVSGKDYKKHRDRAKMYAAYQNEDEWDTDQDGIRTGLTTAERKKMKEKYVDYDDGEYNPRTKTWSYPTKTRLKSKYKKSYNKMKDINENINRKLINLVSSMPKMKIDAESLRQARADSASAIGSMASKIAAQRKTQMEASALGGYGGVSRDPYSLAVNPYTELYGDAAELTQASGGIYGLGSEMEEIFANTFADYEI